MKNLIIFIFGCWGLIGCGGSGSENAESAIVEETSSEELAPVAGSETENRTADANKPTTPVSTAVKGEKIDFEFLTDCKSLETWQGAIQGVQTSGSPGIYIMGQCFANRHYDVIVYSKQAIKLGEATDTKSGNIKKGLPGATYYAFEIPKKEAEDPEDEFESFDYIFPSDVKVYQRRNDGWYLINRQRVSSFEELGRLKLNTIQQHQTS